MEELLPLERERECEGRDDEFRREGKRDINEERQDWSAVDSAICIQLS